MKIFEIISESRTAELFHGTSLRSAERILDTNSMQASAKMGKHNMARGSYDNNDPPRIVSLSRNFATARVFAEKNPGQVGVIFVLDQDRLFSELGKRRMTAYNDLIKIHRTLSSESEEAVIGDIKDIDRYIKNILIFVDPHDLPYIDTNAYPNIFKNPKTKIYDKSNNPLSLGQLGRIRPIK